MGETNKSKVMVNLKGAEGFVTFSEVAQEFHRVIRAANPRIQQGLEQDVQDLFETYDALSALPPEAESIVVDNVVVEIRKYLIPTLLTEWIPPVFVTITGRQNSPDLVLRHRQAKVKLSPERAKTVVLALTKYLRIPSTPFTRPEGISLDAVREENLGLGDFYNVEEKTHESIRYVLDPEAINPHKVWDEINISDKLHVRMVSNLISMVTDALMPNQQQGYTQATNPSQA